MFEFNGFGQRLQNLRKSKNMTQGEFADRLGVTSQAVSKWENELCYPDITLIPSIATILGVEVNYLFGYKEQDFKVSSFPKLLGDLPLVHQYKNVACYSSKEVDFINESGIKFKDGSTVELSNRLVVNVGKGEIKLLDGDDAKNTDFSVTSKSFEFGHVDSLIWKCWRTNAKLCALRMINAGCMRKGKRASLTRWLSWFKKENCRSALKTGTD